MRNKIVIKTKSRKGRTRPFGVLIINCPVDMPSNEVRNMNYQCRELLNESINKNSNTILSFGAGVSASFIRLG